MKRYSQAFKMKMVQKMLSPNARPVGMLAKDAGVPESTLFRWREVATLRGMPSPDDDNASDATKPAREWSADEKLAFVLEAAAVPDAELGAFLRSKGVLEAELREWRQQALAGLAGRRDRKGASEDARRIRDLERELRRKDKALAEAAALLVLKRKSPGDLGGRGRRHGPEEREVTRALVDEAVAAGARRDKACEVLGLDVRTLQRWANGGEDGREGPKSAPSNRLSEEERRQIIATATSPEFRDQSPKQIVPILADRGRYLASESTFYRVLHAENLQRHRGRARPSSRRPREHVADGPWQLASWDITYLKGPVRGQYFYLYLVVDVWSRKIIGWAVHETECATRAAELVARIKAEATAEGNDLAGWVLHADNGGPMKGATMLATLQRLGVVPSFSRPRVADDNPFAEALFRTMKYCPEYPSDGFASLDGARAWVTRFVGWYNERHLHSGIGYVTPSARHAGGDVGVLAKRRAVYERARQRRPERWARHSRPWTRPLLVTLNPDGSTGGPSGPPAKQAAEARPPSGPRSAELGEGSLDGAGRAKATRRRQARAAA